MELKKAIDCYVVGRGRITDKESYTENGYYYGTFTFEGIGKYESSVFKVWFQNENHIAWKDDQPVVMSPDIITMVNNITAEPTTNDKLKVGDEIAIMGIKGRKEFYNDIGIEILGPKHFGFDFEFQPIDTLL